MLTYDEQAEDVEAEIDRWVETQLAGSPELAPRVIEALARVGEETDRPNPSSASPC